MSLFPREFVEFALLNSAASILKIRGSFAIRGARDARTTLVDALFYRIEARDRERAASFPWSGPKFIITRRPTQAFALFKGRTEGRCKRFLSSTIHRRSGEWCARR